MCDTCQTLFEQQYVSYSFDKNADGTYKTESTFQAYKSFKDGYHARNGEVNSLKARIHHMKHFWQNAECSDIIQVFELHIDKSEDVSALYEKFKASLLNILFNNVYDEHDQFDFYQSKMSNIQSLLNELLIYIRSLKTTTEDMTVINNFINKLYNEISRDFK
jgi:hypothetical protein